MPIKSLYRRLATYLRQRCHMSNAEQTGLQTTDSDDVHPLDPILGDTIAPRHSILLDHSDLLCFIHRLPTEVLETIFDHRARDHYVETRGGFSPTMPGWVNISHVCRRWRNIALNYQTLWTYLSPISPRLTEELLVRSKRASLNVCVAPSWRNSKLFRAQCFVEQVMNHVERIQELYLYTDLDYARIPSRPAPLLRTLRIRTMDALNLSSAPFNGDTPALHTLDLMNSAIPWIRFFNLNGLTELRLRNDCPITHPHFQENAAEFLPRLSAMQNLTHLHLEYALTGCDSFLSSAAFYNFQKIDLPRLSHLSVVALPSTHVALLSCVNIPLQAEVHLECHFDHYSSYGDHTPLCSLLAERLDSIRSLDIVAVHHHHWRSIVLRFRTSEHNRLSLAHTGLVPETQSSGVPLQIELRSWTGPMFLETSDMERITSDFCCCAPLTNVQSLRVVDGSFSQAFWTRVLGHLHHLRHLDLRSGDMPHLAPMLFTVRGDHGENQDRCACGTLVPELEELALDEVRFSNERGTDATPFSWRVRSLCDALSARKASRGRVTIRRCEDSTGEKFDMVGRWEGGRFQVVDER